MSNIYTGPGKILMNGMALVAEGSGGRITAKLNDQAIAAVSSWHGTAKQVAGDLTAEIDLTPFDDWSALPLLFPLACVATGGTTPGALHVGGDAHDPLSEQTDTPCSILSRDGRLYTFFRAAVTGHPEIHLAIDKPFFGGVKITCLGKIAKLRSDVDFLMDEITDYGDTPATDTGPAYVAGNLVRGAWTGAFTGTGLTALSVEDGWVISPGISYNTHKEQSVLTRKMTLANAGNSFTVKGRLTGPSHTQLIAALNSKVLGSALSNGTTDLVLTSPTGKTITFKRPGMVGGGVEFGGSQLGTSEVTFYNCMTWTAGVPDPCLLFSA